MQNSGKYVVGIDIGTSKAAVVATDKNSGALLDSVSVKTNADIPCPSGCSEQNSCVIFEAVFRAVKSLDSKLRRDVSALGITGQMHGVILWNEKEISPLYTWKDKRTSRNGFIDRIRKTDGCAGLREGYGAATMAYFAAMDEIEKWRFAATICDYFVFKMCNLRKPVTDCSNAVGWGLFDVKRKQWDFSAIKKLGIPAGLFPDVSRAGAPAGRLCAKYAKIMGLPAGIPVYLPIGDNQASLIGTSDNWKDEIYLTIGTGAQLSVIIPEKEINVRRWPETVEIRPFLGKKYLAVAAPLCGGQAFEWLIDSIQSWLKEIGIKSPAKGKFYKTLDVSGLSKTADSLVIKPHFLGERYDFSLRGEIIGIDMNNFSIGNISAALAGGVIANIQRMMPAELYRNKKIVVCSGNAIRRLKILQEAVKEKFDLPLRMSAKSGEAALGAARVTMESTTKPRWTCPFA